MVQRVSFLVDGFNLYHSVKDAERVTRVCSKWLDIRAFLASYLPLLGRDARLESVHYFSALATHLAASKPDVIARHQTFIEALKSTGVVVELGRFKPKDVWCSTCRSNILRHEEKETDVAIAVRLLELVLTDTCDMIVLLTGDTDVAPAIRTARRLRPEKAVSVVLPYKRGNAELKQIASACFQVKADRYQRFLFPPTFVARDGRTLTRPSTW